MEYVINYGVTFTILIVILFIGGSVAVLTGDSVDGIFKTQNVNMSDYQWYYDGPQQSGTMLSIYSEFLVVAVAVVSGLVFFYIFQEYGILDRILG